MPEIPSWFPGEYLTYKEWKLKPNPGGQKPGQGEYLTYKEWKPDSSGSKITGASIRVSTLPIRNGNNPWNRNNNSLKL